LEKVLELPSKSLKHLGIWFSEETQDFIKVLEFPDLQVLKLGSPNEAFPAWFRVPFKLMPIMSGVFTSIPSISALRICRNLNKWELLVSACPQLEILQAYLSPGPSKAIHQGNLLALLQARRREVQAGTEFERVRLEIIKTLVIPFAGLSAQTALQLREYVGTVVDHAFCVFRETCNSGQSVSCVGSE